MGTEQDPAAEPDLRAQLLKAAQRQASPNRIDKTVVGGDKARLIKIIIKTWGISRGDYVKDSPTDDELVNLCISTPQVREAHWMLYMARTRMDINFGQLIRKPVVSSGAPSRQIQVLENDLTGPARDIYRGLRVNEENVGLVFRLKAPNILMVYGALSLTPPASGSISIPIGDPREESSWRTIFPLDALVAPEPE